MERIFASHLSADQNNIWNEQFGKIQVRIKHWCRWVLLIDNFIHHMNNRKKLNYENA